ncbi:Molybdenum cofactor biosynthesis protein B|nr:Molybdenum cofactor biosynthesis protein B [Candidatus Pantoea persica]
MGKSTAEFMPVNVAVLTVSDGRDASNDTSGDYLRAAAREAGHVVVDHAIVGEDVQVAIVNGGTGFNAKNVTPEALQPLFDREIEGFGELFRMFSFEDIGGSTLQSRAVAGIANGTLIFTLPDSMK